MKKDEFTDFYKTTYNYFKGLMFVKFKTFDEDVLQDAYILLYNNCEKHDPNKSNIKTYFAKIILNEFILKKRKESRINFVDVDMSVFTYDEPDGSDEDLILQMYGYLDTIPKLHQNIIKDFYFNKLSYNDISEKYDMNLSTMKSRMRIAKRMMRSKMEKSRFF